MFLKVVALTLLLLLPIFNDASMMLDDPAFSPRTEYGMSRARSPTYDYQFDPEVFWGYNRQDNVDNGTAIGANGFYMVTKDLLFFRVDNRDCKKNKAAMPKTCICYSSPDVTTENPVCDNKPLAHICQRETANDEKSATFTTVNGQKSEPLTVKKTNYNDEEEIVESVHVKFDGDEVTVTATNYLGGGLHMANMKDQYLPNLDNSFYFTTSQIKGARPNITQKYLLNKDFQVDALEIYFPEGDGNCARLDYYGLAYTPDLLLDAPLSIDVYTPTEIKLKKDCPLCTQTCADMKS